MDQFLIQAVGIAGFIFTVVSYQCKNSKIYFIISALAGFSFALNYLLLGTYTAALLNTLNIFRGIMLAYCKSETAKNILSGAIFAAYLVAGLLTFDGIASLMATFAQLVGTVTLATRNGKIFRLASLLCVCPIWLVHNIMCGSFGGVITEIFTVISILVFITRFGWKNFFRARTI